MILPNVNLRFLSLKRVNPRKLSAYPTGTQGQQPCRVLVLVLVRGQKRQKQLSMA
jgi:hypothetical protein